MPCEWGNRRGDIIGSDGVENKQSVHNTGILIQCLKMHRNYSNWGVEGSVLLIYFMWFSQLQLQRRVSDSWWLTKGWLYRGSDIRFCSRALPCAGEINRPASAKSMGRQGQHIYYTIPEWDCYEISTCWEILGFFNCSYLLMRGQEARCYLQVAGSFVSAHCG